MNDQEADRGSVSQWIAELKEGDESALLRLHQRYWPQVVRLAQGRLEGSVIGHADAEDIAQTTFISLHDNFKRGRVPNLEDRQQLLALLTHIVACKAANEIKYHLRKKRGGGATQNALALEMLVQDPQYTPLEAAILQDCYAFYLNAIPEPLRAVAELHLSGLTNREIAQRLDCVERTVERKLARLRTHWQDLASESLLSDVTSLLSGDGPNR